jgi:hypothetical protein
MSTPLIRREYGTRGDRIWPGLKRRFPSLNTVGIFCPYFSSHQPRP